MRREIIAERLARLGTIQLGQGSHESIEQGACAMELVSWLVDAPWSDRPPCVSGVIGAFVRRWNDDLDDEGRQRLKPYLPRLIGTNTGEADEQARAWLATDWIVRVHTPAWLRLAKLEDQARALEALALLDQMIKVGQ